MPSDIQVFVRFKDESTFAGELIQCIITFKNVASISDNASDTNNWQPRGSVATRSIAERSPTDRSRGLSSQNPRQTAINSHGGRKTSNSGHRTTTSLTMPPTGSSVARPTPPSRPSHKHQRSVSILSLGSPNIGNEDIQAAKFPPKSRPTFNHGRSASLQVYPRKFDANYDGLSSSSDATPPQVPIRNAIASVKSNEALRRGNRANAQLSSTNTAAGHYRDLNREISPSTLNFKFPPTAEEGPAPASLIRNHQSNVNPQSSEEDSRGKESTMLSPTTGAGQPFRVLAGTSVTESNRSSGDFQSLSNQSQETLLSEQASIRPELHTFASPMMRQHYRMGSTSQHKRSTETLLMGYAQVSGTFTLDGALVDRTPFEEVKRKGFMGGQGGGGVVGVKTPSNARGFLGGFNLNSIGESIGGLLGGADMSSLKEMKDLTSSRAIPLLSTPQSLLFVDLTLVPGEEKSFLFRYNLPKGLPASHKGKAVRITYNLVVGIQGAPGQKAVQAVRRVSIPFKVFSGVNNDGEILGHDMMQPYVILQDNAHTEAVESASSFPELPSNIPAKSTEAATQEFLTYVDTLLNKRRRRQSSSATLEPPSGLLKDNGSSKAREAIDRAIFLSKQNSSSHQSSNRFEIARNGKCIATIVLDNTLHRLGESVTASVDLSNGQMPCYFLRCTLESTEKVNPALALRSAASITRLSRRVYASQSENTLFAERIVFSPSIPTTATPTLLTSGVNLDWALRFEFVTTRVVDATEENEQSAEMDLLERVSTDDRGSILAAVETLQCEAFDVSIPITVYGDTIIAAAEAKETIGLPI